MAHGAQGVQQMLPGPRAEGRVTCAKGRFGVFPPEGDTDSSMWVQRRGRPSPDGGLPACLAPISFIARFARGREPGTGNGLHRGERRCPSEPAQSHRPDRRARAACAASSLLSPQPVRGTLLSRRRSRTARPCDTGPSWLAGSAAITSSRTSGGTAPQSVFRPWRRVTVRPENRDASRSGSLRFFHSRARE